MKERVVCNKCGAAYDDKESIDLVKKWTTEGYAPCPNISCPGQLELKVEEVEWPDWAALDKDVRAEVLSVLESCQESSEMSEQGHPKHGQYIRALLVAREILRTE